ncbi:MAG: hypothetical protein AAGF11_18800 [Myxococcota bacterium]
MRRVLDLAVERAAAHGLDDGNSVARYVGLVLTFGCGFDEDPLLPWAHESLQASVGQPPPARVGALYEAATPYLRRVAGGRGEHFRRALVRIRREPFTHYEMAAAEATTRGQELLAAIYPAKAAELADRELQMLLARAKAVASEGRLAVPAGTLVTAALMLLLGSSFHRDPLYPWATEAFALDLSDPLAKARTLHERAIDALESRLRHNRESE